MASGTGVNDSRSTAALTALQAQIDNLGERMEKGFDELKDMILSFDTRVRGLETREAGSQPVFTAGLEAARKRLDEHELQLRGLEKDISKLTLDCSKLTVAYGVLVFIGSSALLSVIALIWALITGQAEVVFK